MASCVLSNVIKNADGSCRIQFADGNEFSFNSLADIAAWIADVDGLDNTRKVCVAFLKARSSDLTNLATVRNKTFTFDLTAPAPIKVQ